MVVACQKSPGSVLLLAAELNSVTWAREGTLGVCGHCGCAFKYHRMGRDEREPLLMLSTLLISVLLLMYYVCILLVTSVLNGEKVDLHVEGLLLFYSRVAERSVQHRISLFVRIIYSFPYRGEELRKSVSRISCWKDTQKHNTIASKRRC